MTDAPAQPSLRNLSRETEARLFAVRQMLVDAPGSFSLALARPILLEVIAGMSEMQERLRLAPGIDPQTQDDLRRLTVLSAKVQGLFRQANAFYGTLAIEAAFCECPEAGAYG